MKKPMKNHIWKMLICCLIPVVIAGILFYFGFKTYATLAIVILCPILHYFMMKDMHEKNKEHLNKSMSPKEK